MASGWVNGVLAACLLMGGVTVSAQSPTEDYTPVTEAMLVDPPPGDWPMWRRTYNHWGHSPLDQIDATNVGSLRLAWA
jgi:alcohol dehydrogenase (cytochrome c)